MLPGDFATFPYDSVTQNTEHEVIARNIMIILARTGNIWRNLSWEEYVQERIKDGGYCYNEKSMFDKVVGYCVSEDAARLFSPSWKKK